MEFPDDLRYTHEHEWARLEGELVRVGISDYAQDALGDVVYVELPSVGDDVKTGEVFGEVESTKSVSDLYAPVSGAVVEINGHLEQSPELVNSDPYGEGWMIAIRPAQAREYEELFDKDSYESYLADAQE